MWGLKYLIAAGLWYIGYQWLKDKYELYSFDWSSLVKTKQKKAKDYGTDPEDYYLWVPI